MATLTGSGVSNYNVQFFANRALMYLKNALGIARFVNRGYEDERNAFGRGDVVKLRRPRAVAVKTHSNLAFESLAPEGLQIELDTYRHASFEVPDLDLVAAGEQFVTDHIQPNVVALANAIEASIMGLYKSVGPNSAVTATPVAADITAARKVLFDNKCPVTDETNMFFVVSSALDKGLLDLSAFTQWQGSADRGVSSQISGSLGRRYGFNFFASQNVQSHDTTAFGTLTAPLTNGAVAVGATTVAIDGTAIVGGVVAGDIVSFAGDSTIYAITADATAAGNAITVSVSPAIQNAIADNAAVTFVQTDKVENLAFHRDAFALVVAPLPQVSWMSSALVRNAIDESTGLSVRVALGWDITDNKTKCRIDTLYGVRAINPLLACRARA